MIDEPSITVSGNLTADPELTMTRSGTAVATFTIASTPRLFDRASNRWRDGEALFLRCTIWRQPAEHVAELAKGTRVIATGRLKQHTFETRDGEKRTVTELDVDDIGPSLRFARVRVRRVRGGVTVAGNDAAEMPA
ncbi:MAG: single-stranded DNA-binding protein [Jatrophihabitans sp.]|nr:MAG: single-stranded DNA-binding protein [Jatrophihabitans sp.]